MKFKSIGKQPPNSRLGEINFGYYDRFTIAHFFIGMAYGGLELHFWTVLALAIIWEIIENPLKAYLPLFFPNGTKDTWSNAGGDVVAVLMGWGTVAMVLS